MLAFLITLSISGLGILILFWIDRMSQKDFYFIPKLVTFVLGLILFALLYGTISTILNQSRG